MILDNTLMFAEGQSVAAAAGTALIGDVVNVSDVRDVGNSRPLYLVINCTTSIITGGLAGTIKFQLVSDNAAAIATDGTASVHLDTGTFVTDGDDANDLDAGTNIAIMQLPMEGRAYEQYLGILAVIATETVTAGAIDAFLTLDPSAWKSYADATN